MQIQVVRKNVVFLRTLKGKQEITTTVTLLKKHNLLTFDNFLWFSDMCLMYKLIHDLAPPPLKQCVSFCRDNVRVSRAAMRGDCSTKFKRPLLGNQNSHTGKWNSIPLHIRDCTSLNSFKKSLKTWLKENQSCDHWSLYIFITSNLFCMFFTVMLLMLLSGFDNCL